MTGPPGTSWDRAQAGRGDHRRLGGEAGWRGPGYWVGSTAVLTAAHVIEGVVSVLKVLACSLVGRSADAAEGARMCPRRRGTPGVALFRIQWDHLSEVRLRDDFPWLGSSVAHRADVAACDEVRQPQPFVVLLPCVVDLECRCDAA